MIAAAGLVIVAACIAAALRRLLLAASSTRFDPGVLWETLRSRGASPGERTRELARIGRAVREHAPASWDAEFFEALARPPPGHAAEVNELLTELDYRLQRWSRVPRVCTSIASTTGFLLAALALRAGLEDAFAPPEQVSDALHGVVFRALDVIALGVMGAAVCLSVQREAARIVKRRQQQVDQLVDRFFG